ncbi:hypothetical protein PTKIN_Ptkin04bG0066600 [Pterospermum kingtungense]
MYSGSIMPILHLEEWDVPYHVRNLVVLSPFEVRQVGRRRTSRMRSAQESSTASRRYGRSRCGEKGHNRINWIVKVDLTAGSATRPVIGDQPSRRQRSGPRRYGFCRQTGHTRNKCPLQLHSRSESGSEEED